MGLGNFLFSHTFLILKNADLAPNRWSSTNFVLHNVYRKTKQVPDPAFWPVALFMDGAAANLRTQSSQASEQ